METIIFSDVLQFLSPEDFNNRRYEEFKKSGVCPEIISVKFEIKEDGSRKKLYADSKFESNGCVFYRRCKKPIRSFISS
jgi:hypothetical protein